MRRLLLVLALSMFVALFASCEKSSVREGRKVYKDYFKEVLKDPSSLKVYSEKYELDGKWAVKWTLDIGAKNSYGAMVRSTYKIETFSDSPSLWVNGEHYTLDDKK